MDITTLKQKANYSTLYSDNNQAEIYKSFAILPDDERAFQSRDEVDEFLKSALT